MRTIGALLSSFVLIAGCDVFNGQVEEPEPAPVFRGSTDPLSVDRDLDVPNNLEDIALMEMNGFDRVEFEFTRRQLPGYTVEYVNTAGRICGTNLPSEVEGTRFVRVTFQPTDSAVANDWRSVNFDNVRGVRQVCARGDEVEYVIGVRSREPFRVLELTNPPRLVLDVRSRRAPQTAAR